MKLTFLGTGTSSGIPIIGCTCKVCLSKDFRDKRQRCATLLQIGDQNILIDGGPDIRNQLIKERVQYIDGVIITHSHFDHVFGLDDLRPFTFNNNIPLYADSNSMKDIKKVFPYIFDQTNVQIGGGLTQFDDIIVNPYEEFKIDDTTVLPLSIMHGRLPILGYKIGNLAYLTDVKTLPEKTIQMIQGVDTLVLNCLRPRLHPTHLNFDEALNYIKQINPKRTYFIHMDHEISHQEWENILPDNVYVSYDGLQIDIKD